MGSDIRQIALYGKGSCGKSTVAVNLAVALQRMNRKVLQVGCSPKVDSTCFLLGGKIQSDNILEFYREKGIDEKKIFEVIKEGTDGIWCAEAGGPAPAEGCAGRGTALALDFIKKYDVAGKLGIDFIIYDVIADVVCGGFAQPMREGYAKEIYLVANGELMSLYSANNICLAVQELAKSGADVRIAGIINNMRGVVKERELMQEFGRLLGVGIVGNIPRSELVSQSEAKGGTVMEKFPDSPQASEYRNLAKAILDNAEKTIPTPVELSTIMDILRKYQAL